MIELFSHVHVLTITSIALCFAFGGFLVAMNALRAFKRERIGSPTMLMAIIALAWASAALADTTAGPNNSLPKADIVMDNGTVNAKGFSNDPQIASIAALSTGPTATTTSLTVMKSATLTLATVNRGALIANATQGTITINRSGLYRARLDTVCSASTGNVTAEEVSTTTDDSTYTTVTNAKTSITHLTGVLAQAASAVGYFSVTTAQAAAGTFHAVWRASNSAATTTCSLGGLTVERVDQSQPPAYP